jgi:hypothetical protein
MNLRTPLGCGRPGGKQELHQSPASHGIGIRWEQTATDSYTKIASAPEIVLLMVWYGDRVKPGMTVAEVQPVMNETLQKVLKM